MGEQPRDENAVVADVEPARERLLELRDLLPHPALGELGQPRRTHVALVAAVRRHPRRLHAAQATLGQAFIVGADQPHATAHTPEGATISSPGYPPLTAAATHPS